MKPGDVYSIIGCIVFGYIVVALLMNVFGSVGMKSAKRKHGSSSEDRKQEQPKKGPPRQSTNQNLPWHVVLTCRETATVEEIKMAYRKCIAMYHPDKVAELGRELQDLALIKSKEINAAFAQARKARQF